MAKSFNRVTDVFLGLIILPAALILVIVVAVLNLVFYRLKPFYIQERVGRHDKAFKCIKIQAMHPPANENEVNNKLIDVKRTTALGSWLRNRGLDELPQVVNILAGQMSFVGPRPLLEKNLKLIEKLNPNKADEIKNWKAKRAQVRPGLSGWHQIHSLGPGIIKYDLEYLNNPTLSKHLRIFFVSSWIILVGKRLYFGEKAADNKTSNNG